VDARTDLFSLGVTMYEMATGSLPFEGATQASLREAILTQQPIRPRKLNQEISAGLERIILKSLEKEKPARYQHAAELRADLERLLPTSRRTTRWLATSAVGLLAALGVTLSGIWLGWFGPPSPPELKRREITFQSADDPVVSGSISPGGQSVGYTNLAGLHVRRIDTGETWSVPPADENHCFGCADVVSWFPDGTRILLSGPYAGNWGIWVLPVGGQPRKLYDHDWARGAVMSPDGSRIAFIRNEVIQNEMIWLGNTAAGPPRPVVTAPKGYRIEQIA
jgi:hypothetical protein